MQPIMTLNDQKFSFFYKELDKAPPDELEQLLPPNHNNTNQSFFYLKQLPTELQSNIVSFLQQQDLLTLCKVSKLFYNLAVPHIYRRIYLNDSFIETSRLNHLYRLASNWTWLKLSRHLKIEHSKDQANHKVALLIKTLRENKKLTRKIYEIRLNWDLDVDLQLELVKIICDNSKSIRIIENITDPRLNKFGLQPSRYASNLISLDLPPPYGLPAAKLPPDNYLSDLTKHLTMNLTMNLKHLTLFVDPILLFNNVVRPNFKLELESFKYHCRPDTYPNAIYNKADWKYYKLSEIFDIRYLKNLTIISWYDSMPASDVFKFDDWADFENLQDITLIAVVFDDCAISRLITSCNKLRRLKLDFGHITVLNTTRVYKAIMSPRVLKSLEFLDLKLYFPRRIFGIDLRTRLPRLNQLCECPACFDSYENIIRKKIFPDGCERRMEQNDTFFNVVNYFSQFTSASLLPYSKAVDRYPSVRTSDDTVEQFLENFNELNRYREEFTPLETGDFYKLFEVLIHSWKSEILPFVHFFDRLKFLVVNDVALIIVENEEGRKAPLPLYYNKNFESNF